MNYFAHALPFLDRPYFVAGTAVPDWLAVVDRPLRVRRKHAEPLAQSADPQLAAVAAGLLQHLRDDRQFHATRAFAECSLELAAAARLLSGDDADCPSWLLGHLLVEVLLDASLAALYPEQLEKYYRALDAVDCLAVQQAVNQMAPRPTERLAAMIDGFRREQIISDYLEDGRLLVRLDQVMRRLGFPPLSAAFAELLPSARQLIDRRRAELLSGTPA